MSHRLLIEPFGILANVEEQETILQAIQRTGVQIAAYCNGIGMCGKCKIKIIEQTLSGYGGIVSEKSHVSPMTKAEKDGLTQKEIKQGYRLACMTRVNGDVIIEIPTESYLGEQVILEEGKERSVSLDPGVKAYVVSVEKPTLGDTDDDFTSIKKALLLQEKDISMELTIRFQALRDLPKTLRQGNYVVTVFVLYGREIIKVLPGEKASYYGLAIDVGTTTVAMYLCDMKDGSQIASTSCMNPQIKYGDDVLTRITYCQNEQGGMEQLQRVLMDEINRSIKEMFAKHQIDGEQVLETVMVFNTVMEHIALNISPDYIGTAPFTPAIKSSLDVTPKEMGLSVYKDGNVHCLPIEAAFVGADNVAVLLAEEPYKQDKKKLIMDIGTNSEICLGNREKMYSTSCATGPALEGAQIFCGMRAAAGAIAKVKIHPKTLKPTITCIPGMEYPIGICGSGIIDAVAQMAITGIIEADGKFSKAASSQYIRTDEDGKKEYVLYFAQSGEERDIVVKQKDVRAVQLAKAALYAGAKALMKKLSITNVEEVVLAGGFGSYIDKENALALGMYPDCEIEKVTVSGNAAGMGAKLALCSVEKRREAEKIAREITFIETATDMEYQTMFSEAMPIPHQTDPFFANKKEKWTCVQNDIRALPERVLQKKDSCFVSGEEMERAMELVRQEESVSYLRIPLMQNLEAVAYGGMLDVVGEVFAIRTYRFQKLEQLPIMDVSLLETKEIQTLLSYIEHHKEERIVLDVEGPFTILAGLMGMENILRAYRKEKALLGDVLDKITKDVSAYVLEAIKQGVDIISLAEPEGDIGLVGQKVYREVSGYYLAEFMKNIQGNLKKAIVHICGKTSYGLAKSGFVVEKVSRVEEKEYMEILFELSKDRKTKFVGHGCFNENRLKVPLITKLDLASSFLKKGR